MFKVVPATHRGATYARREEHDRPGFAVVDEAGREVEWFGDDFPYDHGEAKAHAYAEQLRVRFEALGGPVLCTLCGATVTAKDPEGYPYCRSCHYMGRVEAHLRAEQLARFRAAFPDAEVDVEHTGGGCFWLAFRWPGERFYYVATDGEASLPAVHEDGEWRSLPEGGWGYVGRHADEDENLPEYEGVPIREPEVPDGEDYFDTYPRFAFSDAEVVATIRADRAGA
jgi:hypothetical protein